MYNEVGRLLVVVKFKAVAYDYNAQSEHREMYVYYKVPSLVRVSSYVRKLMAVRLTSESYRHTHVSSAGARRRITSNKLEFNYMLT
jgi:hypothetical protein